MTVNRATSKSRHYSGSGEARRWLETACGPGSAEEIIRRLALGFWHRNQTVNRQGERGRVLSGSVLMDWGRSVGIREITPPPLTQKAHITPCKNGFRLSLRASTKEQRSYQQAVRLKLELDPASRWDFAHELGHIYFYDTSIDPPKRVYGHDVSGEETLCQQFAAELLLPYDRLIRLSSSQEQLTVESIVFVATAYGAPLRAVVRRLVQDIMALRAVCVIISSGVATSWPKRCLSDKPLPKTGIEIYSPPEPLLEITGEHLLRNEVVRQVCSSGTYCNSDICQYYHDNSFFVEGLKLKTIAPRNACLFLFHEQKTVRMERLLFDR